MCLSNVNSQNLHENNALKYVFLRLDKPQRQPPPPPPVYCLITLNAFSLV